MKSNLVILILFSAFILLFSQCKKEEDEWAYCMDCDSSDWVGTYDGVGNYYRESDSSSTMNIPTQVIIDSISATMLKARVIADSYFSSTTMISKTNNEYFVEIAGSSKSLSLTLSMKNNDYKLSGTSKYYHYKNDTILIVDETLSFETFKILE